MIIESDIDDVFQSVYTAIMSNLQKPLGKDLSWIIVLVKEHNISLIPQLEAVISNYQQNQAIQEKGLIDIQDVDDNECFKCSIVRYLNPSNHHPSTITKADKYFAKKNYFKEKDPIYVSKNVAKKSILIYY